jgi:hypothetical protein
MKKTHKPEDFINFDQQRFRRFSGSEIAVSIIAIALIIICVFQVIQFS